MAVFHRNAVLDHSWFPISRLPISAILPVSPIFPVSAVPPIAAGPPISAVPPVPAVSPVSAITEWSDSRNPDPGCDPRSGGDPFPGCDPRSGGDPFPGRDPPPLSDPLGLDPAVDGEDFAILRVVGCGGGVFEERVDDGDLADDGDVGRFGNRGEGCGEQRHCQAEGDRPTGGRQPLSPWRGGVWVPSGAFIAASQSGLSARCNSRASEISEGVSRRKRRCLRGRRRRAWRR